MYLFHNLALSSGVAFKASHLAYIFFKVLEESILAYLSNNSYFSSLVLKYDNILILFFINNYLNIIILPFIKFVDITYYSPL